MKKLKTKISFKLLLAFDLLLLFVLFFLFKPFGAAFGDKAFAEALNGAPYTKTFIISAYYSPLPCQARYFKGSYDADMKLNGGGRGADGRDVYAGMIAAPKSYEFGTKMDIPGVGIVAVHDRGGAIVPAGVQGNAYDRLDVWMGFGDKGMARALDWGKRTVEVTVYGVNDAIAEQVQLGDYSAKEATPNDCATVVAQAGAKTTQVADSKVKITPVKPDVEMIKLLSADLKFGDSGENVLALQEQLAKLNLYRTDVSGYYGDVTKHAVFKFQQTRGLVADEKSPYAGILGPKTRKHLNSMVASYNYNQTLIAKASDSYLARLDADKPKRTLLALQLKPGMRGAEVAELQKFLKQQGFFEGNLITEYYGPVTEKAVTEFQKAHKLVNSSSESAAGYVGPATLELINMLS
ncbi:peptidoglycan-binding protein [Candidatus Peregrinibacteria bacterium]|nr:peptidoglycan-binding protein [Candidatus Peregrinibacteria bacterium]